MGKNTRMKHEGKAGGNKEVIEVKLRKEKMRKEMAK